MNMFSKLAFVVLVLCPAVGKCTDVGFMSGQVSLDKPIAPKPLKVSEIIKDNDLRYLATLGAGSALTAAGIIVILKSCWNTKSADDYKNAATLEDWEKSRFQYVDENIRGGSGWVYLWTGLFIIGNAKNIPAFYDRVGEWFNTGVQRFLNDNSVRSIVTNGSQN